MNVYVGPSVGNISGQQYFKCNQAGNFTFTIAANPAAPKNWSVSSSTGLGITYINQTGNQATFKVDPTSSTSASGTITCTVTDCDITTTKTINVYRNVSTGLSGPSSICVGSSAYYYAAEGSSNQYWTTSSNFMLNGNTGGSVMLQAVSPGSGVLQVSYNRACDNLSSTDRMGVYANSCGYFTATDQVTLSVSPNPASDVVEVTYTMTKKAYPVKVYNAYQKVVASGTLRNGKLRLNLGHAPVGVYLVNLLDEERGVVSVRLAKN